jgi:hypothetical protein
VLSDRTKAATAAASDSTADTAASTTDELAVATIVVNYKRAVSATISRFTPACRCPPESSHSRTTDHHLESICIHMLGTK